MKMSLRERQKEQTREKLMEAACRVFTRQGILMTRMEDIAREAGVSHGTVFAHFRSQEELTEAVTAHYGKLIAARTHDLAEEGAGLKEVLAAHLQGIGEYEGFYTRLLMEARLLPQGVRDVFVGIQSVLSFHFSRALKQEGDIPAALLFNLWIGLIHHYLANGDLYAPGGSVIQRYGPELMTAYLRLIQMDKEERT